MHYASNTVLSTRILRMPFYPADRAVTSHENSVPWLVRLRAARNVTAREHSPAGRQPAVDPWPRMGMGRGRRRGRRDDHTGSGGTGISQRRHLAPAADRSAAAPTIDSQLSQATREADQSRTLHNSTACPSEWHER